MRIFARLGLYLWTLPTTLPGLILALAAIVSGGTVGMVDGVLEVSGGFAEVFLGRIVGVFLRGGASAITFGHVVIGRNALSLELTRRHERVHVLQCQRWGPLFIPAYLTASLIAWMRGRHAYRDNAFEVEAFAGGQNDGRS